MSLLTLRNRRKTAQTTSEATDDPLPAVGLAPDCSPIADARWRDTVRVAGRVRSVRVQPWADVPALECTLVDATGGLTVVFLGRRKVPGIQPGAHLAAEGVVGDHHGRLAMLNPDYTLLGV